MRRLHRSEWLHLAQAIPVGSQARHKHVGDSSNRPNLVVYNNGDSWSAYCMACKAPDRVFKTHVRYSAVAPRESASLVLPRDAVNVHELPQWQQEQIGRFLASKGMDYLYLPGVLQYSRERERLLVHDGQHVLGRDLTGKSPQKWLTYHGSRWLGEPAAGGGMNVMVEDPFSYYKVRWAMRNYPGVHCICTLGTRPAMGLMLSMVKPFVTNVMFYDGDKAGHDGARYTEQRLSVMDARVIQHCAPTGLDPKDMQVPAIQHHLESLWNPALSMP